MPTIKDIADILDISTGTVSKGLNGGDDISEQLRNKILDTAVAIGYKSKRMQQKENKAFCIFLKNLEHSSVSQFSHDVILGFKQIALPKGYRIELINATVELQKSCDYDTYMLKHGFQGGFFMGFSLNDPWILRLSTIITPTVLLDNFDPNNHCVSYVGTDNVEAMRKVVEHFVSLGHRKIGFINGDESSTVSSKRGEAFLNALTTYDLELFPGQVQYGHYSQSEAKEFVPDFVQAQVTAIMCCSDIMAMGVITRCQELGLHVPNDISVVGFDDLPLSAHLSPALSSIRQERGELGKLAFTTLCSLLNDVHISQTLLRPTFIVRESTGPCEHK